MGLCDTFKKRSFTTWNLLSKARRIESQLGEETLTDVNLLELKLKHPREIITTTFTKPREAITGADWEWWLTGPSGDWLGFRVQAKVIELQSSIYEHLHYKSPKRPDFQADLLIRSALSNSVKLIPMYCLYSNWNSRKVLASWPCRTYPKQVKSFGCSIISAFIVRYLRITNNANDLKSLLPYMRPWQCIVCCQGYSSEDLPRRAWAYWKMQVSASEQELLRTVDPGLHGDLIGDFSNLMGIYNEIGPTSRPPNYVMRLMEGLPIEPPDEGLRHITIFREIERPERR